MQNYTKRRSSFQVLLPSNFDMELKQLEESYCQGNRSPELVIRILNCYSMAIEFYDFNGQQELFKLFLHKNNEMMNDPQILDADEKNNEATVLKEHTKIRMQAEEIVKAALLKLSEMQQMLGHHFIKEIELQSSTLGSTLIQTNIDSVKLRRSVSTSRKKTITSQNTEISKVVETVNDDIEKEMLAEIEYASIRNGKNLEKEIEEIRNSYLAEISPFADMPEEYEILVDGMNQDLISEIENLTFQYEERLRLEIERIKSKYL